MKALNNKILYKVLEDEKQPQKSMFSPNADMLKHVEVISIGHKVEFLSVGDIATLYVNDMYRFDNELGFCSDRSVLFKNGVPQEGKVHIKNQESIELSSFGKAEVIESNSSDVKKGDIIYYRKGQSHILPDHTEIISESQVYYK